jgi:hypothetical protein
MVVMVVCVVVAMFGFCAGGFDGGECGCGFVAVVAVTVIMVVAEDGCACGCGGENYQLR